MAGFLHHNIIGIHVDTSVERQCGVEFPALTNDVMTGPCLECQTLQRATSQLVPPLIIVGRMKYMTIVLKLPNNQFLKSTELFDNPMSVFYLQNMPFQTKNKPRLLATMILYLGGMFTLPFIAVRFQMAKQSGN